MLDAIITQTSSALEDVFQTEDTNQMARQTGLVERSSKMDGVHLLKTLVFGFLEHPQGSLSELCQTSQDLGVLITKQGLDERLTEKAVCFLQACFAKAIQRLQAKRGVALPQLEQFSEVYLQDSTIQSLPASLQELFPGCGGNASSAAIKIQLLFGLLSGNLVHVELQPGRTPDTKYNNHVRYLQPGSLLIQDLGFFNLATLQSVQEQQAFFLSRWRQDVIVYLADQSTPILDIVAFLNTQTKPLADYAVQVGKTTRLPCRMIGVRLPQKIIEKRRRRVREDAQRRGNTPSARALALCAWNIFLTNLPPERLTLQQLLACYALRWQVELIFKLWKSQAGLKHLGGSRKGRLLCEVYAKLIGLVLFHFLVAPLRFLRINQHIEISLTKATKILQHCAPHFLPLIGVDFLALQILLDTVFRRILSAAHKDFRIKKPSSMQCLALADHCDLAPLLA